MLLAVSLNDTHRLPHGSVRLQLDWGRREWTVDSDQGAWKQVGYSNRGQFEVKSWGVLWLWDNLANQAKRNTMIVWNAPIGPLDILHKNGRGRLFDPKNPNMKDAEFGWTIEQNKGLSPLRQKALDICRMHLPAFPTLKEPPNCLESEAKTKTASGGTGCGGFPGWLITKLGAEQFAKDTTKVVWEETVPGTTEKVTKSAVVNVTSPTVAWEQLALAIEKRRNAPGTVWKLYNPGEKRLPKPGDIYTLKQPNGWFRHVGVLIDSSGKKWRTADGGQGGGFAVGYRGRKWTASTALLDGEDGKPAFLKGWVDLDALVEKPA